MEELRPNIIGPQARLIAFYLPQFHPIPENDRWWGKGFTEWTNVAKAKPLFPGHYQPHVPADLGFYDLRIPETRVAQAEMAREYGIEGFCYYHYWFAGKRLLDKPFNQVLQSGEPKFPFCLAWANQSWTGIWHGTPNEVLIEQTYPGSEDYEAHFYAVLDAFMDDRYIKIDGKPVFIVYYPYGLPEPQRFTESWQELAVRSGLKGIYFVGIAGRSWGPQEHGFDAAVLDTLWIVLTCLGFFSHNSTENVYEKLIERKLGPLYRRMLSRPTIYRYQRAMECIPVDVPLNPCQYPCVMPNWDNTPRSNTRGVVFHNSTPELFRLSLEKAIRQVSTREPDKRLVFIKSWNEWAEGNYLEPDQRFGKAYLDAIKSLVLVPSASQGIPIRSKAL